MPHGAQLIIERRQCLQHVLILEGPRFQRGHVFFELFLGFPGCGAFLQCAQTLGLQLINLGFDPPRPATRHRQTHGRTQP